MLEDMSKDALFYNYYTQWIEVYKKDAIREATMAKYRMTQKWVEKLAPELKVCELTRTAYQKILNDYAKEHERQTTLDFHHQLKGAVMDAVDEGLIERDPTRKAIIKGKTPREKKIKYLNQFELHTLIADLDIKEEPNWDWFILLVAKTGMRFSEALAITPKDFDFGRQTLSISKTWDYKGKGGFLPTKNKSSVRKIQIDWQIAFVVDECHRAVSPATKRIIERFFGKSLWFGFTGTPRFPENPYPLMGDLPRTTEELYGACLHKYTIQNAIHDNAVLGFQVEHDGPKDVTDETDSSRYENETHMLKVLEVILNKSYHKLGFQNGKGKTFEGLLTTSSISIAQKYYELLTRVKNGETPLKIDERIKQVLPDFPKFAITYSVTENEDGSQVNQEKMKQSLDDYNAMFDTKFDISQITSYNSNLNKRLSRKDPKYKSRNEQLDLVIVVDRLLTGFDAPCMSTIFIDRQPMGPHDLIQAFSRTNRIFDKKSKPYGQIVTFQAPVLFKKCVDDAVKLYSAGSTEDTPLIAEWDDVESAFKKALAALRIAAQTPDDIPSMSDEEKLHFMKMFQSFDRLFAQLKSFSRYDESMLDDYGITEQEYIDYAGHYLNIKSEIGPDPGPDPVNPPVEPEIDSDYELMAYSNTRIDYEYIINLIQNIVNPEEDGDITPEEKQKKIDEAKQYVEDLRKDNPKVADIMSHLIDEIELDESRFKGKSILNIVENMKHECIEQVVSNFCLLWHADKDDVMYAATHYRNGVIPNESAIKASIDYPEYKNTVERALPKFKYYAKFFAELRSTLDDEIKPLV